MADLTTIYGPRDVIFSQVGGEGPPYKYGCDALDDAHSVCDNLAERTQVSKKTQVANFHVLRDNPTIVIFSMKLFLPFAICGVFAAIAVEARHQMDPDTVVFSDLQKSQGEPCRHGGYEKREVGGKATKNCDKILDQIGDICKKYFSDDGGDDDDGVGWVFKYL